MAPQEGVRPGQRLLALSDPIRGDQMWPITPSTSSLSRVRDAFKVCAAAGCLGPGVTTLTMTLNSTLMGAQLRRAPTVDLVLSPRSIEDQLEGAGGGPSAPPARPSPAGGNGSGALAGGDGAQRFNGAGANPGEWRGAAGAGARGAAGRLLY